MSLRYLLQQRITKYVIKDAQSKMPMRRKSTIIIADSVTIRILHHCFKIHELNELDIGLVAHVKYARQRMKICPIYFLSADVDSVKKMCEDYEDPAQTRYSAPVFCYFCSKVSPRIVEIIKNAKIRNILRAFNEVQTNFLVREQRVFTFARRSAFDSLYVHKEQRSDELARTASQLVALCISLNELPYIRYSTRSRNSRALADLIQQQFKDSQHSMKDWLPEQNHATLLIIDRSDDPITPLMHDLAFQPMVMDLLHPQITIDHNNQTMIQLSETEAPRKLPDDRDSIWVEYRHSFIGDVVTKLPKAFSLWQSENAVAKMKKRKKQNVESGAGTKVASQVLIEAARDMPQYKQLVKSFKTNINMASLLSNMFNTGGLRSVISVEQDLCTGVNDEGEKVKKADVQRTFCNEILMDENKAVLLKLRIFMVYVMTQTGMPADQRRQLLQQSGFDASSEKALTNLRCLGVDLRPGSKAPMQDSDPNNQSQKYWQYVFQLAKTKAETTSITRYTSYLEYVLKQHFAQALDEGDLAWIEKPKKSGSIKQKLVRSYRKHKKSNTNKNQSKSVMIGSHNGANNNQKNNNSNNNSNENSEKSGPRIIVFILGGISYAEIKSCYEFANEKNIDVFIGSTQVYGPQDYISLLRNAGNNVDVDLNAHKTTNNTNTNSNTNNNNSNPNQNGQPVIEEEAKNDT